MIDHIGGKYISIRADKDGGLTIRQLETDSPEFHLTADAWFELLGLAMAIKASVDFAAQYHS